jgi:hypothetical protein
MKTVFSLPLLIIYIFFTLACNSSSGGSDANDAGDVIVGTVPEIKNAILYVNWDLISPTSDLPFGSLATVQVFMEDPDLDIVTLYITIYVVDDNDGGKRAVAPGKVYEGPIVIDIVPEPWPYFSEVYNFTVAYPPGNYLIGLQAEDENGNTSREWTKAFRVISIKPDGPGI